MKTANKILISILLSVLVIGMGSGVVIVNCMCKNSTSIADYSILDNTDGCCHKKKAPSCMKIGIKKLSPTEVLQHANHSVVPVMELAVVPVVFLSDIFCSEIKGDDFSIAKIPAPPRLYLSRICVLII